MYNPSDTCTPVNKCLTDTSHDFISDVDDRITCGRNGEIWDKPIKNNVGFITYFVQYEGDIGQLWVTPEYDSFEKALKARRKRLRKGFKNVMIYTHIVKKISHRRNKTK